MPPGMTSPLVSGVGLTGLRIPISALVEPDADQDGFGDETQDQCPGVAGTVDGCPPPAPPAPPAPPPVIAPAPADTTAPVLSSSAATAKLSKSGSISFLVTSSENTTGSATATITVPKTARTVRFSKRSITRLAGIPAKVTLKLSKKDAAVVRRALARKRKLTASVALTMADAAGNRSAKTLALRLSG